MRSWWQVRRNWEQGQTLPLLGLSLIALFALVGFGIDVGRIYATRTELTRSLDSGALAGVQELPDMVKAKAMAEGYVAYNDPQAFNIQAQQVGAESRLRVTASKKVDMTFLHVVGVPDVTVTQTSVAGMGTVPMDVVMSIDVTGSMGRMGDGFTDCPSFTTPGCKIFEAKEAANALTDILIPAGTTTDTTKLGMAAFNWCWKPTPSGTTACRNLSGNQNLTNSNATIKGKVSGLTPNSYTNVCEGLLEGRNILFGAGSRATPPAFKAIVLMTDGANTMATAVANNSECEPGTYTTNINECPGNSMVGSIGTKTYNLAQAIKAQGVEIFVVALGVCDTKNSTLCNPSQVGSWTGNYPSNLLKCVASSLPGSNDHYFETDDPAELTAIFTNIARLLALRIIE
jgi:Flp pilus assembly protein TadG